MNRYTRIRMKLCGMRRIQDLNLAVSLGVDALGFIFYPKSPRYLEPDQAIKLVRGLPPFVDRVGVFVNEKASAVVNIAEELCLNYCQFHGDESPEYCRQFNRPYVKSVRVKEGIDIIKAAEMYSDAAALLLDSYVDDAYGGSGKAFDWSVIPKIEKPLILAGGIAEGNLIEAMASGCYALDVCSGIEDKPGEKNPEKMKKLMQTLWSDYGAIS